MKSSDKTVGNISWRSPSNIALVKYWGKRPVQIPANPSLSMTLSKAYTEMGLTFRRLEKGEARLEFLFEGLKNEKFAAKIASFLDSLSIDHPKLSNFHFQISSFNTFPHSTGIASSASSMSALGLCLAECLSIIEDREFSPREASFLSRLASGSACRSVYGGYTVWGESPYVDGSHDEYAVPLPFEVHPVFRDIMDNILIVSSVEKKVSSRAGHSLMEGHPYAEARFRLACQNIGILVSALSSGDIETFIRITESEALNLHALMMSSLSSYLLIEPNTVNIVNEIRRFREETTIPVCFTLDAGPNVHLLYPAEYEENVKEWIGQKLVKYCENGRWIDDGTGTGPIRLPGN